MTAVATRVYNTLTTVDAVAAHPEWRIFDCRHSLADPAYGETAYAEAHIPGALFMHLDRDLSGQKTGTNGRHPLPEVASIVARLSACGVDQEAQVVAYDDHGGIFASRLWWLLRWLGHDKVAVLDGGLSAWREAGQPVNAVHTSVAVKQFSVRSDALSGFGRANAGEILSALHGTDLLVIDARSPDRYAGQNETLDPVGGHIPGAINRFYAENLDPNRTPPGRFFKSPDVLKKEFVSLIGDRKPVTVVQQCGSGVTACHNLLAMEIAGLSGSRLYPGSWSEWCADPARPIATG